MFFGELVRHGIFSHDAFVRHLIAAGVFEPWWQDQARTTLRTVPSADPGWINLLVMMVVVAAGYNGAI